ncbi:hypothetical protein Peur_039332 [Populus x canadensis]
MAPGRCSKWVSSECIGGVSSTEPYIVGHNMLLAHAAAVHRFRDVYQVSSYRVAASRALAFSYGWFMEPLKSGRYPVEMANYVQERLPQFYEEQSLMLKGSFDFIGIDYCTSTYASDIPCNTENLSYSTGYCVNLTSKQNGIPIGPQAGSSEWLYAYPKGIEDLLLHTKYKFDDPVIYITENGNA